MKKLTCNQKNLCLFLALLCSLSALASLTPLHQNGIIIGKFRYRLYNLTEEEASELERPLFYAELYSYDYAKYDIYEDFKWVDYANAITSDSVLVLPSHVSYQGHTYTVIGLDAWRYPTGETRNGFCQLKDTTYSRRIKRLVLPDSMIYMASPAFIGLANLESIVFPPTLKTMNRSFSLCEKLKTVDLPSSLEVLCGFGLCAFESFYIPKNVKTINNALQGNNNLREITVDAENPYFDSRDNCNGIMETASNTLIFATAYTEIPASTEHLGDYVFQTIQFANKTLYLPQSLQSIGKYCFCLTNLESIPNFDQLPITTIEEGVFANSALKSISIPPTVTSVNNMAFGHCKNLEILKIGKNVTEFNPGATIITPALMSISVEDGNTKYDSRDNCNAIILTESNTLIRGCKYSSIPSSVKHIGDSAFCETGFELKALPKNISQIGKCAFYECTIPNTVRITPTLRVIGPLAFCECDNIEKLIFEYRENRSIGSSAFSGSSVKTAILNVDEVNASWLGSCKQLHTIVLDDGVEITNNVSLASKDYIKRIVFDDLNENYCYTFFNPSFGLWTSGVVEHPPLIITPVPNWSRTYNFQSAKYVKLVGRGDINIDESVDGVDLNILINRILNGMSGAIDLDDYADLIGDINYDDQIDGADLNAIINLLLEK